MKVKTLNKDRKPKILNKDRTRKNLRNKMKLKKGDKVIVITGKREDKGKVGEILRVFPKTGKVLIQGINLRTKHKKVDPNTKEGGIVKIETPLDASNVMYYCESAQKPTRIGYRLNANGTKVRFCKLTGEEIVEKKVIKK